MLGVQGVVFEGRRVKQLVRLRSEQSFSQAGQDSASRGEQEVVDDTRRRS